MQRRRVLQLGLGAGLKSSLLLTLMGRSASTLASTLIAVRIWPSPDFTRLTLEADQGLKTKMLRLDHPPRIHIDIDGLILDSTLSNLSSKLRADDPVLQNIRTRSLGNGLARIELNLKQSVKAHSFSIAPVAQYQYRQVFDFYPERVHDPLSDLIAKHTTQSQRPGQSQQEDLDHILNRVTGKSTRTAATSASRGETKTQAATQPQTKTASKPQANTPAQTTASKSSNPSPQSNAKNDSSRLIIVAVDAGHGGEDPGAIGPSGVQEKDIVLNIAKKLAELINQANVNGNPMRAFLTRSGDYFVPLANRVRKARQVQADLFISIHADAYTTPTARGASVYALSTNGATSASARWLAQKENQADLIGGVKAQGKDRLIQEVLLDLSTSAQIRDSLNVGSLILNRIGSVGNVHKPRVEQASFAVLKAPDIPSILVETAFISNPEEEAKLSTPSFQNQMADSIMGGIYAYFKSNPPLSKGNRQT